MVQIHPTADVSSQAVIGSGTSIWNGSKVREGAQIGSDCLLGLWVYVDVDVIVGDRVRLHNRVSLYRGARIGDEVFIGPHTCLLNDRRPRAVNSAGEVKKLGDWIVKGVSVQDSASIGGGSTILPGVNIGRYAFVGAGSVVTRDVPNHALMFGNPARQVGYVCECGARLDDRGTCSECGRSHPRLLARKESSTL